MSTATDYKTLYEQSQVRIIALEQQLLQLQKMIFGSRQERFVPADPSHPQLAFDLNAAPVAASTVVNTQQITYKRQTVVITPEPLIHPGRMKLPESLRREVFLIEPAEDTSGCKKIQEEVTEVLEYEPGELYVKQYRRPKYAKPGGEGVVIGQLSSRPLPKAMAGEGLLAQIVIDKYVDHLPLCRQMQRFERTGLMLPYSTITDWVSGTCQLITPLVEALKTVVLQSGYLHADEPPIKVMDKDKKGEPHRRFYWVV
ncbi:MAG: transposase [Pseudobacter sp.]|uniref:transposase n=1 Tax=Pseudobacter sp. TaxID=2045420 RepID=UPI003F805674